MSGAVQEVQWSDLQRDPKSVAELADAGDVRVRRRDGAPLILTREDRHTSAGEGAFAAARALRNIFAHASADTAATALAEEFPWLGLLPADEIAQFVLDFVRASQAAAELGQWSVLAQTIQEWKATAAIYADPTLVRELTKPVTEDYGSAPAPVPTDGQADA